jgi:hypothetical protein
MAKYQVAGGKRKNQTSRSQPGFGKLRVRDQNKLINPKPSDKETINRQKSFMVDA